MAARSWPCYTVITPQVGGMSDAYAEQVLPVLLRNVRAYAAGDRTAMLNLVKREK
jgi:D-2-hydroxyacid dehydrogenase (NADP+)